MGRGWCPKGFPKPHPLYRLQELHARPDAPVLVVEGEKAADAAASIFPDYVATTSPHGAKSADKSDWSAVKGRQVIVWPDNDKEGSEYANAVARLCSEAGAAYVAIVGLPKEFPEKWDLADPLPPGWSLEDLNELLKSAKAWEPRGKKSPRAAANDPQPGAQDDDEATFTRLAALSPVEYDRQRENEAKRLGIRVGTLDAEVARRRGEAEPVEGSGGLARADPEPWSDRVVGSELLADLVSILQRYVVLPEAAYVAVALWILHAHAHDSAGISPILAITSPTPECGKTTLLTLLGALVPRPLPASNITSAALFRAVERWRPTLLVDEADTFLKGSDELRGVINCGHCKSNAYVVRTVGEDHEPRQFATWAPKAIAMIGSLHPTLASRALHVELRRIAQDEQVEGLRGDRLDHMEHLCRKAFRLAQDHVEELRVADPAMPPVLRGRAADNWRPLLAIADLAGGDWPRKARHAAEILNASRNEQTAGLMLLEDLQALFAEHDADRLPSAKIVEALGQMEDRPWSEWKNGKPITTRQLARLLEPFKVTPGTIRFAAAVSKGYRLDQFDEVFRRYLPSRSVTPLQASETAAFGESASVTSDGDVTDRESPKPAENLGCNAVTDEAPESWEVEL